jgi:hypothetical protein
LSKTYTLPLPQPAETMSPDIAGVVSAAPVGVCETIRGMNEPGSVVIVEMVRVARAWN